MVLWSPLICTLTTPEVSTTNAETGHPLASQASIAVVAASSARASGRSYPDCATCAAAEDGRVIEAQALKVIATATDFIMLVSLGNGVRLVSRYWKRAHLTAWRDRSAACRCKSNDTFLSLSTRVKQTCARLTL